MCSGLGLEVSLSAPARLRHSPVVGGSAGRVGINVWERVHPVRALSKEIALSSKLNPYLGFRDTAKQAMEFYQSVFGGELTRSMFGEYQASDDPAEKDKIMNGILVTDSRLTLMGADTPNSMNTRRGITILSPSAARTRLSCAGSGAGFRLMARLRCRSNVPLGVTSSECALTSTTSTGWSMSPAPSPRMVDQPRPGAV